MKHRGRTSLPSVPASALSLLAASLAALVAVATGQATAAHAGRDAVVIRPTVGLAIMLSGQTARAAPNDRSARLQWVRAKGRITDERTVLPIVGRRVGPGGVRWLHVLLPGRPNGHTGWIKSSATKVTFTTWHIVVDTGRRRVTVYKRGHRVVVFKAVVGKPSTPTPTGKFYVEESVELGRGGVGGPFALALSARSNVFQEFEGGPGQIALHGLMNVGGVPGTAVSHGCVRLDNDAMHWLVVHVGPGVPVTITA